VNSRERVFHLLAGQPIDCLPAMPITMMFAADQLGRKYLNYSLDSRVLAEAQIQTATAFDFDHVSCIAETREAPDCGAEVEYFEDQPPAVVASRVLLQDKSMLGRLKAPSPYTGERMSDRLNGVRILNERIGRDKIVEGWVEGPCAAAADVRGLGNLMLDFYDDPAFVHDLFEFVLDVGSRFALAQLEAGADLIGIGDAAASLVSAQVYREFIWPFEERLVAAIHGAGGLVRLHICGNTQRLLTDLGRLGCEIVELDSMTPLSEARSRMRPGQVVLGNVDPVRVVKNGTPESVYDAVRECHRQAGGCFIVGAGCEIPRGTPSDNLLAMVKYAREHTDSGFVTAAGIQSAES